MPNFRINNFGGGLTDHYLDPDSPTVFERLDNVTIDDKHKILQREGYTDTTIAGGSEQVAGGSVLVSQIEVIASDGRQHTSDTPTQTNALHPGEAFVAYQYNNEVGIQKIKSVTEAAGPVDYRGNLVETIDADFAGATISTAIKGERQNSSADPQRSPASTYQKMMHALTHIGTVFTFDSMSLPIMWATRSSGSMGTFKALGLPPANASRVGAGFNAGTDTYAYIWYWHYYTLDNGLFVSGPVEQKQEVRETPISGAGEYFTLGVAPVTINANEEIPNGVQVAFYRTLANSNETFYITSITPPLAGTTNFTDNATDEELINNTGPTTALPAGVPSSVYITGGVLDNEQAPRAKYCVLANDVLWLGNVITPVFAGTRRSERLVYSKSRQPHSFPGSFFVDMPAPISGLSSIDIYPIVFTTEAVYRMEGITTDTGSGQPLKRLITDRMGTNCPHAIVKAEDKVFWLGTDGIYMTDGYKYTKVTVAIDDSLREMLQNSKARGAELNAIVGDYNSIQKRIYWAFQENRDPAAEIGANGFINDVIMCLDLKSETPRLFTYFKHPEHDASLIGGAVERDSAYYPVSLAAYRDILLVGDSRGYIFQHRRDLTSDLLIEPAPKTFPFLKRTGTIQDCITAGYSFGSEFSRKWVSSFIVACKNYFDASRNLTLQLSSINDDDKTTERSIAPVVEVRTDNKTHVVRRKFPKGGLRCFYKQLRIRKGLKEIASSETNELVDINGATVQLQNGSTWGIDVDQGYFYSSADDFATGTFIDTGVAASDTAILVAVTPFVGTDFEWYILEYPQDEKFRLESFTFDYQDLGESASEVDS